MRLMRFAAGHLSSGGKLIEFMKKKLKAKALGNLLQ